MKISEIITDKYKLRIPPAVFYELLADVQEAEEPTTKDDLVTLTFSKGTLKYSYKDYVVYKKDWLRSHYGAEIDIMFGDSQYKEPTTKNDLGVDCISRDSAIKALDYDIESFEFKLGVSKYMDDIAKLLDTIYEIQVNNIKSMPSVTPQEPKTGHWIAVEMEKYSDTYGHFTTHEFKCSNCGGNYIFNYHKYCPNCGAKMAKTEAE